MKKSQLATGDFVQAANALTNEVIHGLVHLTICEGIAGMDPYIGGHAPVFFNYTFYGSLYAAQMYASKIFDTHGDAFTVPKFLEMARLKSAKFPNATEKDVLTHIDEADIAIRTLNPTLKALRMRRNNFLAHLSTTQVFSPKTLQQDTALALPQVKAVLVEGGNIVNRFLPMCNNSVNHLFMMNTDDYKKLFSLASKQLCAEIKAHEAEFSAFGMSPRLPRPRDCP